jgi:hypothetical protein
MNTLHKLPVSLMRLKGNISEGYILTDFFKAVLLFAVVTLLGCAVQRETWPEEVQKSL